MSPKLPLHWAVDGEGPRVASRFDRKSDTPRLDVVL
jgi:hypothetical protein